MQGASSLTNKVGNSTLRFRYENISMVILQFHLIQGEQLSENDFQDYNEITTLCVSL